MNNRKSDRAALRMRLTMLLTHVIAMLGAVFIGIILASVFIDEQSFWASLQAIFTR